METSANSTVPDGQNIPTHFLFQWHVTERCNLRCRHCYQESAIAEELPYDALTGILIQFADFIALAGRIKSAPIRAHITITGGEPFIRPDFPDLLGRIAERRDLWTFAVLSNGTLIDKRTATELAALGPRFVQVSIEGNQETHDRIRGPGSYRLAVRGIEQLVSHRVPTTISFTVSRDNMDQFGEVAKLARSLGVQRLWADRMIPVGGGAPNIDRTLSPQETLDFFETMAKERKRFTLASTEVAMHRALQFLAGQGTPYRCSAGYSLVTVLPDGGLVPCRRMPIPCGNILEQPLSQLYYSSPVFRSLRERDRIPVGCEKCFYSDVCNGGLKCLSAAIHSDPFVADPGCWLKGSEEAACQMRDTDACDVPDLPSTACGRF